MYRTFLDLNDEIESVNGERVETQCEVLTMPAPRDMWIRDYAIDTHIRNIVATYGLDATYSAIRRLTNGEQIT